jgi:tetratricopeptide (TPR) repeat protein
LSPDDAQALNYLGYTYAEMGTNLDEALEYLKKAVSLRPDDGFIIDSLGWVYFRMKRYNDAVHYLEKAHKLVDDDATIMAHLAEAYYAKHEYRRALSVLKRAQQIDPDNREIADRLKKLKAEIGEK